MTLYNQTGVGNGILTGTNWTFYSHIHSAWSESSGGTHLLIGLMQLLRLRIRTILRPN